MLAEEESCRFWRPRGLCVAFALLIMCGVVPTEVARAANWTVAGQNISNSRTQPSETVITPTDAAELAPKWTFTTHGNVSATPTVYGGIVYFPDNGGYLNAISATTGRLIWQRRVSSVRRHAHGVRARQPGGLRQRVDRRRQLPPGSSGRRPRVRRQSTHG